MFSCPIITIPLLPTNHLPYAAAMHQENKGNINPSGQLLRKGKGRAHGPNCQYTASELDDKLMLEVLKMEKGNQSDSRWKSSVWTAVLNALTKDGSNKGGKKTPNRILDHFSNVQPDFMIQFQQGCFPPFSFPPIIVMVLRVALVRSLLRGDGRRTHC